jgi:hypothetical protein
MQAPAHEAATTEVATMPHAASQEELRRQWICSAVNFEESLSGVIQREQAAHPQNGLDSILYSSHHRYAHIFQTILLSM